MAFQYWDGEKMVAREDSEEIYQSVVESTKKTFGLKLGRRLTQLDALTLLLEFLKHKLPEKVHSKEGGGEWL